ncbi:hypothetical protein ACK6D9_08155 [Hoeflea sp. Naph1]|uniref:hypothetical protein n=1 Tax=Hoeflea sp. Naph1 TaxID=3388653 RepID=UPI00398FB7D0
METDDDYDDEEFVEVRSRLNVAAAIAYNSARSWIKRENLDAVIAFNGRIDATNAIMQAAKDAGKRYISVERTWFGDGLQLLPEENCLGLKAVHQLVEKWADFPLTNVQARKAASIVAARFMGTGNKEWRTYNVAATSKIWPGSGARRILLLPGSRSEIWGVPDYAEEWPTRTEAYDGLISHLALKPADLVLRAHPNWGEKIGRETGQRSERYYQEWARQRGIHFVPSVDNTSTLGLIEQADAVVVASSSAALEAGLIGKRVLALAPSPYSHAGFEERAYNLDELKNISRHSSEMTRREISRKTLRFCYTFAHRIPQYVDYVRCVTSTQYEYHKGGNPQRFLDIIQSGKLSADDDDFAADSSHEDTVLELIEERKWTELMPDMESITTSQRAEIKILRRNIYRSIDFIRSFFRHGDR